MSIPSTSTSAPASSVEPLLSIRNLAIHAVSGKRPRAIVSDFGLEVRAGEIVAFVGESGSGKSLTARALIGLPLPGIAVTGSIVFDGRELVGASERERAKLRGTEIALVLQDPFTILDPLVRCGAQILETLSAGGRKQRGLSRAARRVEVQRRLAEVGISDPTVADRYPFQLSGGMRQRVALACALSRDPRLLIADEPTTALDAVTQREILRLLRSLQRSRGMTIILITHDLGVAFSVCERVCVLYAGSLLEVGPSPSIAKAPQHPYTLALLQAEPSIQGRLQNLQTLPGSVPSANDVGESCPFTPRCSFSDARCSQSRMSLAPVAEKHYSSCLRIEEIRAPLADLRRQPPAFQAESAEDSSRTDVLCVQEISKSFSQHTLLRTHTVVALDAVSLRVGEGETVAVLGESGSGKTTLGRCVVGLENADAGAITVCGARRGPFERLAAKDRLAARTTVQMVFQDPYSTLNPMLSVGETLRQIVRHCTSCEGDPDEVVLGLLRQVGLPERHATRKPALLSGGERQRIAIARALAVQPKLIVLDEPVSALDVSVQGQILELLRTLQRQLGLSYLFITHDLAVVRQLAHRVYVMRAGRIVEEGTVAEVIGNPRNAYTRQLRDSVLGAGDAA